MRLSLSMLYLCQCKRNQQFREHKQTFNKKYCFTTMKTTFLKTILFASAFVFTPVLANEFDATSVEKTYIKCTIDEKGDKVPNYFVVVKGVAHQTDSRTFFEVKKARAYVKKNNADNKVADNNVQKQNPELTKSF